jgi:hypothetical protein
VARLHPEIAAAARQFVLLRPASMRGLDLNLFDFDYDLTWFAMMLSPEGAVLGRFGGRDADTPGKYQTLAGLRHSLEDALARFRNGGVPPPVPARPDRAENYAAAGRLTSTACIHCHHVYEFRREARQQAGSWKQSDLWVYPQPDNIGLMLDLARGNRVLKVQPGSAAADVGMRADDLLESVDGLPVSSIADIQAALHHAPWQGKVAVRWQRQGTPMQGALDLAPGWKKTDLSWRWSLKSLSPSLGVQGEDLNADERRALGLPANGLAFRQAAYLSPEARHAGVRINDVILGVDEHRPAMTARQFETFIRLTYRTGDQVTLHVLRGKEHLELPLKLSK